MTKEQIEKLRQIRRDATFEEARFGMLRDAPEEYPLPKCEADVDAFIRERTRIFRETWILSEIDELLGQVGPQKV